MTVQHWKAELLRITREIDTVKLMRSQTLGEQVWRDWHLSLTQEFFDAANCLRAALAVPETPQPVAHEHSPVLVEQPPQAYLVRPDAPPVPLSEEAMRVVVLQYREKVLAAFRAWDMRPNDRRTWHQVVMEVDLP